jgi:hypothetical protein
MSVQCTALSCRDVVARVRRRGGELTGGQLLGHHRAFHPASHDPVGRAGVVFRPECTRRSSRAGLG